MSRLHWRVVATACLIPLISSCSNTDIGNSSDSSASAKAFSTDIGIASTAGEVPQRVELPQNWNEQTRMKFWFTSQGSKILPYSWFTHLEQPDSERLFRDTNHMDMLRYLPMHASKENPSGLPIGFALAKDSHTGESWVGLTCAACHTNQLDYQGTKILIEGAPTLANFVKFFSRLVDALNQTQQNDEKFSRFAENVLGDNYSEQHAIQLRNAVQKVSLGLATRRVVNDLPEDYATDFTSYARLDAFGNIQNAGTAFALNDVSNRNNPTAPVSYPFLWGTHQSDVVQWNASAPNTPVIGPLVRNIGEVVGVFGELSIKESSDLKEVLNLESYNSSVDMIGLGHLESWVKILRSPEWPQQYLPAIDTAKAGKGEVLYAENCAGCHQVIPRSDEHKKYISTKIPLEQVGTDPAMAWNATHHMAKTLILEGTKDRILIGDTFGPEAAAIEVPVNGVVGMVLKHPVTAIRAGLIPERMKADTVEVLGQPAPRNFSSSTKSLDQHAFETLDDKSIHDYLKEYLTKREELGQQHDTLHTRSQTHEEMDLTGLVYKARPLNGIWATAPYLHNGSVPSLWELLQRPEERVKTFWVGSREFDPKHVGYQTQAGLSEFKVEDAQGNIIPGSSNHGHTWGTDLSDEDKWALVEYMKTL